MFVHEVLWRPSWRMWKKFRQPNLEAQHVFVATNVGFMGAKGEARTKKRTQPIPNYPIQDITDVPAVLSMYGVFSCWRSCNNFEDMCWKPFRSLDIDACSCKQFADNLDMVQKNSVQIRWTKVDLNFPVVSRSWGSLLLKNPSKERHDVVQWYVLLNSCSFLKFSTNFRGKWSHSSIRRLLFIHCRVFEPTKRNTHTATYRNCQKKPPKQQQKTHSLQVPFLTGPLWKG